MGLVDNIHVADSVILLSISALFLGMDDTRLKMIRIVALARDVAETSCGVPNDCGCSFP